MKLYEIAQELQVLMDMIDAGEIPEEAISDTLEGVTGKFEEKAEGVACYIKSLLAEADAFRAEEERLAERRKRKEATVERLTAYLDEQMRSVGREKLETARCKVSYRRSTAVRLTDERAFINWARDNAPTALTVKVSETVNKTALREIIRYTNVPFAAIEERQNIQIK